MKRLCVFAHWDKDNIIDEYVLYYLRALKEVCSTIIFVSDSSLGACETHKLSGIADFIIVQKHGEYDFGSYKRGFFLAKEKGLKFDELIFANDSCYGPFFSLTPIFNKMSKYDFWGMTKNLYGICKKSDGYKACYSPHIQSYFLVFKPKVFQNNCFMEFMEGTKSEACKNDIIIRYEMGLSKLLSQKRFKSGVYIKSYLHTENSLLIKWDKLIKKKHFPFLKTGLPRNGLRFEGEVKNWDKIISQNTNYPVELISKNAARYSDIQENLFEQMNLYRKIRYIILKNLPMEIRWGVVFLEKHIFTFLNAVCFNKLKKF